MSPASSTFQVVKTIPIASYDTMFPCNDRSCIPQPAPLGAVDVLSYRQRPMNRAAYRNYGSYQSIVTNQSVEATTGVAGVRWWEVRNPGANAVLYQDSTFAPADGISRWMASAAQDRSGNIGIGYSAGGSTLFPSIHYTGRLESDPLNDRIVIVNTTTGETLFNVVLAYDPSQPGNGHIGPGESRARTYTFRLPEGLDGAIEIAMLNAQGFESLLDFLHRHHRLGPSRLFRFMGIIALPPPPRNGGEAPQKKIVVNAQYCVARKRNVTGHRICLTDPATRITPPSSRRKTDKNARDKALKQ